MRLAPAIVSLLAAIGLVSPTDAGPARFPATPSDLPLRFEENRGQGPAEALFIARSAEGAVALTRDGALVLLHGTGGAGPATLRLRILGAAGSLVPSARDPLPGVSHYVHGRDSSRWITGVRAFGRVVYSGVYPGVDLVFYGHGRRLEHDFVMAAGADERAIRLALEGADAVSVEPTGDLAVRVGAATARFLRPAAFQEVRGARRPVECAFELSGDGAVGFRVGAHDPRHPLVIDPVLDFATYLAGTEDDVAESVAVDGKGGVYVAGATHSFDFPPVGGIPRLNSSGIFRREEGEDTWVPSWQGLDDPNVAALAVDPLAPDTVYAATLDAGFYRSGDGGRTWEPTNDGIWFSRYQSAYAVVADPQVAGVAFVGTEEGVFKTTDGGITWHEANQGLDLCNGPSRWMRALLFHPSRPGTLYAGGCGLHLSTDGAASWKPVWGAKVRSIAIADSGAPIILVGIDDDYGLIDRSADGGVTWRQGQVDGIVGTLESIVFEPGSSDVVFAATGAEGVLRSTDGGLTFARLPASPPATMLTIVPGDPPTLYAGGETGVHASTDRGDTWRALSEGLLQSRVSALAFHGGDDPAWLAATSAEALGDAYVLKLDAATMQPVYAVHFGGSGHDWAGAIEVDGDGNAYVTGTTRSTDFPVTPNAMQGALAGDQDAFVVRLDPDGTVVDSTYFGGPGYDRAWSIAVDAERDVYVAGDTAGGLPVTPGAFSTELLGGGDGFVAKFAADVSGLVFTTYLGGSAGEWTLGLAVDGAERVFVTGRTGSRDFPTTADALLPEPPNGSEHGVFTVLDPTGSHLVYSTFLEAWGENVALGPDGTAWVVGQGNVAGLDGSIFRWPGAGGRGETLPMSLGFRHADLAVAADRNGLVYATGLGWNGQDNDLFLSRWDGARWSRFLLPGEYDDWGTDVAVDTDGAIYVTGGVWSSNLPVTPGGASWSWGSDGYLLRYRPPWSQPLRIATAALPLGEIGRAYEARIATEGGEWPLAVTLGSGTLPRGLLLSADGRFSGAPSTKGRSSFEIRVTDDVGITASRSYQVEVIPGLLITTRSVPKGKIGKKYSASLKAKGGKAPMSWGVVGAPLPDGLVLSAGTGKISGTPRAAGTFQVQLQVKDAANYSRLKIYSFVIRP